LFWPLYQVGHATIFYQRNQNLATLICQGFPQLHLHIPFDLYFCEPFGTLILLDVQVHSPTVALAHILLSSYYANAVLNYEFLSQLHGSAGVILFQHRLPLFLIALFP
jgi:hypothetical protein